MELTARHIPQLRARPSEIDKHIRQLGITLDLDDAAVEAMAPEAAEVEYLKLHSRQLEERQAVTLTDVPDGWTVQGLGWDVLIARPRVLSAYRSDKVGYSYEREIIAKLSCLMPEDVDTMPLAVFEACRRAVYQPAPLLAGQGRL